MKSQPISTLFDPYFKFNASMLRKNDAKQLYMSKIPYANFVGTLMYVWFRIGVLASYEMDFAIYLEYNGYWIDFFSRKIISVWLYIVIHTMLVI